MASAGAASDPGGLAQLHQVSLGVEIAHPLEAMTARELTGRVAAGLRAADPPLVIADGAADRLRLTISVRPMGATTLRGFWLPFSGTYGIGALRLGVERMVSFPGVARAFPALVWQTERTLGSSWRETDRQIVRLIDEMVAELLEARRQQPR